MSGIAEKLVKVLQRPDGDLSLRPVHTIGIGATGYFEPSPIAQNFCTAEHFREEPDWCQCAVFERIRVSHSA